MKVQTGSNQFKWVLIIIGYPQPITRPLIWFFPGQKPWTKPQSGSGEVRFEPQCSAFGFLAQTNLHCASPNHALSPPQHQHTPSQWSLFYPICVNLERQEWWVQCSHPLLFVFCILTLINVHIYITPSGFCYGVSGLLWCFIQNHGSNLHLYNLYLWWVWCRRWWVWCDPCYTLILGNDLALQIMVHHLYRPFDCSTNISQPYSYYHLHPLTHSLLHYKRQVTLSAHHYYILGFTAVLVMWLFDTVVVSANSM